MVRRKKRVYPSLSVVFWLTVFVATATSLAQDERGLVHDRATKDLVWLWQDDAYQPHYGDFAIVPHAKWLEIQATVAQTISLLDPRCELQVFGYIMFDSAESHIDIHPEFARAWFDSTELEISIARVLKPADSMWDRPFEVRFLLDCDIQPYQSQPDIDVPARIAIDLSEVITVDGIPVDVELIAGAAHWDED